MPTFKSTTYAAQSGGMVRDRLSSTVANGEKRFAEAEYKFTGSEASGDILQLFQLPPGVAGYADDIKLLSERIGGTTGTFTARGDQHTPNRYSTQSIPLGEELNAAAVGR